MEQIKNILPAELSHMTNFEPEPEPYILTEEEEILAIENERMAIKQHLTWKTKGLGYTDAQILAKIDEVDIDARIDRASILRLANANKHYGLWQQQQRKLEKQAEIDKQDKVKELWTAKNMYGLMRWTSENEFGKRLIVNQDNKPFITALCYFVSRDPRFETELGYSLNKGLIIRGVSGLGKTHLVQCLRKNELNPILVLSMLEITGDVKADGEYNIDLKGNKLIYLDDVGTEEPVVNHFGTKISFFKTFIESQYLKTKAFNNLIFSTNNSFSEIEEKYGFRVRSRLKEMMNIIDVKGSDMRG